MSCKGTHRLEKSSGQVKKRVSSGNIPYQYDNWRLNTANEVVGETERKRCVRLFDADSENAVVHLAIEQHQGQDRKSRTAVPALCSSISMLFAKW